ncbi:MAG: PAS domain S-box protein [Phycisphaerales bacterium]|jgi:PAS domain S-box-containing protein|nr:PAS domain S-box protein [Phycisphaerales bacterium]
MSNNNNSIDLKNHLDTIFQTSQDGILVVDSEGRFEFGNEAFFRTFGWPEDELIGEHFIKVIPPDLHDFMLKRWEEVQAGEGAPYETAILHKDGTRRDLLVSHRHMTIANQRKYCVLTKDITERKKTEDALRFTSRIAQQVSDSVVTTDLNFKITYTNRMFEHLYGYSPDEILGQSPDIFNVEPHAEQIQNDIYETIISGRTWKGEHLNHRKDGSTF